MRIQAALLPPALDSCLIALVKAITENPEDAYVSHAVHFAALEKVDTER